MTPYRAFELAERRRYVWTAAAAVLSDRERQALEARADGLTFAEIGAELGVGKDRAMHLVRKALYRVRRCLLPIYREELACREAKCFALRLEGEDWCLHHWGRRWRENLRKLREDEEVRAAPRSAWAPLVYWTFPEGTPNPVVGSPPSRLKRVRK